ncbi:MAG: four helix bundle protein [Bacteroidales bacterium]
MENRQYSFEKLHVWNDIREMIKYIYALTADYPDFEKFGLVNQMRRAAISVSSNLAEGSSRTGAKDQAHFYQLAYSSSMELLSQTIVSLDLNFINQEQHQQLRTYIQGIAYKLNALRKQSLKRVNP